MSDLNMSIFPDFTINLFDPLVGNQILNDLIFMFDWGSIIIPLVWFGGMLLVYYERHIKDPNEEDPKNKKKNKKDNKQEQNEQPCKEHGENQKCANCQKEQKGFKWMIIISTNNKFKI